MTVLFREGAYLNLYVGNDTHMFRFWYREPQPTVLQNTIYGCGCCKTQNILYTSPTALRNKLNQLLARPEFTKGEYMNWSQNQPFEEFYTAGDFLEKM